LKVTRTRASIRGDLGGSPQTGLLRRALPDLGLVRRNGSFRLLFVAAFGSGIGTWFATVALQVDIFGRTHSSTWVALLLVANTLPMVLVGFLLGSLVDRLPRRRLMIGADLVRAAVFAVLPFAPSSGSIVALAFVAGVASAFFRPAVLAGLPNTVDEDELPVANGLLQSSDFLTTVIGPVLGAALVAATSPGWAYGVNALSFVFSAALLVRIAPALMQSEQSLSRGHFADLKEGLSVVVRSPALLTVLVAFTICIVPTSFVNVAEISFAQRALHSGSMGFGLLWTASGVGLVAGSVLGPRLYNRYGPRLVYPLSIVVFAAGIGATAVAPWLWLACLTMVVCGTGNGVVVVSNITLVQTGAPDRVRGRVFTTVISTNVAAGTIASVVAGPLTNTHGPRWTYAVAAVVMAFGAGVAWLLARRIGRLPVLEAVAEPLADAVESDTAAAATA
jgi:MFS family permease